MQTCDDLQPVWEALQPVHPNAAYCASLADLATQSPSDKGHASVLIAVLWNIWKRRNAKVFKNIVEDPYLLIERCSSDIYLWSSRCNSIPKKTLLTDWAIMLAHLTNTL
ncbi:hypothetical protein BRADI_1g40912v3 [Brachypodium distachyon]|uniref:Uncharacterized protein n=1 Tax=Brachypodium distachyon TaxID=15368 RepID=A0A2K2DNN8_BRADI|nr:hypothetical protein BRADI_1g40912v3 [Brachypodium distachyon]